ncbi:MAG: hypothetical protein ABL994_06810 [Verrucomicrobiales bacterium]
MSPFFRGLFCRRKSSSGSPLDQLIAPEIKDDALYRAIRRVASDTRVRQILEIGASSGEGSTAAFVEGASMQAIPPDIHCLEVSMTRFQVLEQRYTDHGFVHCYNCSSVPVERFFNTTTAPATGAFAVSSTRPCKAFDWPETPATINAIVRNTNKTITLNIKITPKFSAVSC